MHERFEDPKRNWLKILTFALSEYAYHYSSDEVGFWKGFCQQINLKHTKSTEDELRHIAGDGFDLLGIVKAKGGYSYVSTLWLQSGIPQQNLNHFTQLVQKFSNEYGWWEIAHTPSEDISSALLDFCQQKHSQWGTLINFLKASCSSQEKEVEPISGQLLQGIAVVATELERKEISPESLKDENQRERLLGNFYLPKNFFLRNWNSLIRVLTPNQRGLAGNRKIISHRQKPLSLVLDVADSLNTQLVLPEQNLWKKGWERLGGTFCQIPEANWEGIIPTNPGLVIPSQVVNVKNVDKLRSWQLLDNQGRCLNSFQLEGVASDFPCLVFDAWTGDRLHLHPENPTIGGSEEIICFTPRDVRLGFGQGIEIIDSCVPSSIRDWQGQQLALTSKESLITFSLGDATPRLIKWNLSGDLQPNLRGLRLKGKKLIYLEIPTLWFPPVHEQTVLNFSIENITCKQTIITDSTKLPPSERWQEIPLDKWITQPGKYAVRFWNKLHRWSYQFVFQPDYRLDNKPDYELTIKDGFQDKITSLPRYYNNADRFWAEEIHIEGLFPLEIIHLALSDTQEKILYPVPADLSGNLRFSLASFYDLLSSASNSYTLHYQKLGEKNVCLLEMKTVPSSISHIWDNQAIKLSGLSPNKSYFLSCWNLLLPENAAIKIPVIPTDKETITVPLNIPTGIYHIQLGDSGKLHKNLGWWCGSNPYDLPDEALQNEDLENYCYTILDGEPVKNFLQAANQFDYDPQLLKTFINSLRESWHFPEHLDRNFILEKLQALLEDLNKKLTIKLPEKPVSSGTVSNNVTSVKNQSKILVVELESRKNRQLIYKLILIDIENSKCDVCLENTNTDFPDYLLLKGSNLEKIKADINKSTYRQYIKKIYYLSANEAQRML